MKSFLKDIKPDITYYNSSRSDVMESDIESAELMVEVKMSDQNDPFNNPPNDKTSYATVKGPSRHWDK